MSKLRCHDIKELARVVEDSAENPIPSGLLFPARRPQMQSLTSLQPPQELAQRSPTHFLSQMMIFLPELSLRLALSKSQGMTQCGATGQRFK